MSLELLAGVVLFGIALITIMVRMTDRSKGIEEADEGTALVEFGSAYPEEAVRAVVMTRDRKAAFFRLAGDKTGFLQAMGRHHIARVIDPGLVNVAAVDGEPALKVNFRESAFKGGTYKFTSQEDAAEVSLWLCGALARATSGDGAREAGHEF